MLTMQSRMMCLFQHRTIMMRGAPSGFETRGGTPRCIHGRGWLHSGSGLALIGISNLKPKGSSVEWQDKSLSRIPVKALLTFKLHALP